MIYMTNKNELANRFFEFESLLRRYYARKSVNQGPAGSIHRGQGRLLTLLAMQSEISQKDLAYILGMRPQSVGELIGKLEKNEWITRTPSSEDKRVLLISLTKKGQAAAEKVAEEANSGSELFAIFSDEEQGQLLDFINRMMEEIAKEVGEEPEEQKAFRERFGEPELFRDRPHPRRPRPEPPFDKRFGFPGQEADSEAEKFGPGCHHRPHHHPKPDDENKDDWNDF